MDTKCDIATKRFTEGLHCSQSVLEAFAAQGTFTVNSLSFGVTE